MAVSHIGATSATLADSSPLTISLHASAAAGDLAILRLHYEGRAVNINSPAGWTVLRNQSTVIGSSYFGPITWYRVLTAADIAAGSVTINASYNSSFNFALAGAVSVYRGADTSGPIDAEAGGSYVAGTNPFSIGPITTNTDDAMLVASVVGQLGSSINASSITPPGTMTELLDLNTGLPTAARIFALYRHLTTTAGSQGSFSFTLDTLTGGAVPTLIWHLIAIKAAVPTVLSVTSNSGPTGGGQTAIIKGTLLTGTSGVTFGGTAATNVTVVDDETVTCTVPAHAAGAVTVAVTATAGSGSLASAYTYTAPAITGLSPARGSVGGGDTVTITGTNFAAVSGVTFGGTAATNVTLVNSTTITCTSPAHAAGPADAVVTDASTTTATIAGGYTYLSVIDKVVKLVKGGVVSGDNKADTVTAWPASLSDALYGGSTDLWGLTPTATEANGSDFGVVIQATLADGSKADIDYAEMTTYYTVTGLGDLPQLLCALTVNTDGQTTALDIYELPRGNLGLANDPNANRAVSDAWFYLSRILKPSRAIAKLWRELEFWLELLPSSNIPGFQVWAAADEGSFIQLRDGNGDAVTIRSEGAHRVFFPPDTTATGHYVQLKLGVPATAGSEQKVAVKVRDMVLRGVWQPISTERVDCTLVLSGDALIGGNPSARSVRQQEADLIAAQAQDAPVPFTDIDGTAGYGVITDLKFRTVKFKEGSESVRLATMTLWKLLYA